MSANRITIEKCGTGYLVYTTLVPGDWSGAYNPPQTKHAFSDLAEVLAFTANVLFDEGGSGKAPRRGRRHVR